MSDCKNKPFTLRACKICRSACKPEDFYKDKYAEYGLSPYCKSCKNNQAYKWRDKNRNKYNQYIKPFVDDWNKRNRGIRNSYTAKRRASKKQAFVYPWQSGKIKEFYKNCPEGYHVDHIIPLHGKNVSGFHCIENLQYLTIAENIKKSNYFE